MTIATIPAGHDFSVVLADYCLSLAKTCDIPLSLMQVYLPTRRGGRTLRQAFLNLSGGQSMILPQIATIGDAEMDEADFRLPDALPDIPAAIDPIKRQIILARLLEKSWPHDYDYRKSLAIACNLGRLIDQIHTENLDINNLTGIMSVKEFAQYWEITASFLTTLLGDVWPAYLKTEGLIDPGLHRHLKISRLAKFYEEHVPHTPVIIAGSTGSIPATRHVMKAVSKHKMGHIILPGLDVMMDDGTWMEVGEGHPQYLLKNLISALKVSRDEIEILGGNGANDREYLMSEMMRPASKTEEWRNLSIDENRQRIKRGLEGVTVCELDNDDHEATAIGLAMMEVAADPKKEKTALLITPDRYLVKRVQSFLASRGIIIDDSAGKPSLNTPLGQFILSVARVCKGKKIDPLALLNVLKSPLMGRMVVNQSQAIRDLEISILRQKRVRGSFDDIIALAEGAVLELLQNLKETFAGLMLYSKGEHTVDTILKQHITVLEKLAQTDEMSGIDRLWAGQEGDSLAVLLEKLVTFGSMTPPMTLKDYVEFIRGFMQSENVNESYGTHPRLGILGQIEARMVKADRIIMAGLNEGIWPPDSGFDVWMSRAMRGHFGLPSLEQKTSLAAHDFSCGFCAREVFITRSKKTGGQPTLRSRWLDRLDTCLSAAQIGKNDNPSVKGLAYAQWARKLKQSDLIQTIDRPKPCPPADIRPTDYSVTEIEKFMRDPYWIYAKKILKLSKLDDLDDDLTAADRGSLIHTIMEDVTRRYPGCHIPDDFPDKIIEIGKDFFEKQGDQAEMRGLWWARFIKTAQWFAAYERDWRQGTDQIYSEIKDTMPIGPFTLTGKVDRVEYRTDGSVAIIDYKTGAPPTMADVRAGVASQLPLEAVMIENRAFKALNDNHQKPKDYSFHYWTLNGAGEGGSVAQVKPLKGQSMSQWIRETKEGVEMLLETFANADMPYYGTPIPERAIVMDYHDYAHLERIKEWSVQGDGGGEQ